MPAVLVHGVPDTHRVWDDVRAHLHRTDVVALDLPGFGAPLPAGFTSTKEEYVDWIISRIEDLGEPVDLVGHDWGCILTARVASLRPDLVRTWAGSNGPVSAAYVWHPLAQIWQTPGEGEAFMAALTPDGLAELFTTNFDLPPEASAEVARLVDDTVKDSILRLYRSAVTVGQEWEPALSGLTAPGLVFWGKLDPACQIEFGHELGAAVHAVRTVELDCNHWTVKQRPAEVAALLEDHWSSLPVSPGAPEGR